MCRYNECRARVLVTFVTFVLAGEKMIYKRMRKKYIRGGKKMW